MDNLSIRRGDTLDLPIALDDDGLITARLIVKESVDSVAAVIDINASFVEGVAKLHQDAVTAPVGNYIAQIDVTYDDGSTISFPDPDNCDGDDDFIQVEVKPSLSYPGVS